MVKGALSQFQLWRRTTGGFRQILGRKPVYKPARAPLKMPRAWFTRKQRQVIIDWYWGDDPDYSQPPKNSMAAVAAQLKVSNI